MNNKSKVPFFRLNCKMRRLKMFPLHRGETHLKSNVKMQLQVQLPLRSPGFHKKNLRSWLSGQIKSIVLITDLFHSLNDNYETYISFGQMVIVHEDHMEKREKASKALDEIVDWKRYRKDKPENIIILSSFQLKKVRGSTRCLA